MLFMKKICFLPIIMLFAALTMTSCEPDRVVKEYYSGYTEQYNDEFTIYDRDWVWDDVHYNWYCRFEDYTIMDRYLMDYSSVVAYEVRYDDRGNRYSMRAIPYSQTWWDENADDGKGAYYTLELSYEYGRGWIEFTYTDSFHNPDYSPGDITIRVCVMNTPAN